MILHGIDLGALFALWRRAPVWRDALAGWSLHTGPDEVTEGKLNGWTRFPSQTIHVRRRRWTNRYSVQATLLHEMAHAALGRGGHDEAHRSLYLRGAFGAGVLPGTAARDLWATGAGLTKIKQAIMSALGWRG